MNCLRAGSARGGEDELRLAINASRCDSDHIYVDRPRRTVAWRSSSRLPSFGDVTGWRSNRDEYPAEVREIMSDGTELETGPGEITSLPPGHDAWVVGDEQ